MKFKPIFDELEAHAPFTIFATLIAFSLFLFLKTSVLHQVSEASFEIFHPLHLLFSAIVTGGIYYKYKKNILQTVLIAFIGAFVVGTLSDVIMPYLGSLMFGTPIEFHFPLFEEPVLILGSLFIGTAIGIKFQMTKVPHFLHVFVSTFASLFYITAFTSTIGLYQVITSFLIVFVSVIIPCCASDIVLPVTLLGEHVEHCHCKKCHH